MRKYFITLTVAALGLALPAHAGSINLNGPDDTGLIFAPLPGNMVQVAGSVGGAVAGYQTPAECGTGFCLENASATFDANFTAQLTSQYNYSASAGGSFNFSGNIYDPSGSGILIATDSLTAAITWNSLSAPATLPRSKPKGPREDRSPQVAARCTDRCSARMGPPASGRAGGA